MDLEDVVAELTTALAPTGLRVPPWGVERITPPAAVIALPERIDYDSTYGRGSDRWPDLPLVVLVGKPEARTSRKAVAAYADGSGPKSVKATLEAHTYTSCDSVRVAWAEFDNARYAGTDYLACIFHLDITGKGA
ncbi:hypothetical protein [Micromonospora mirobrigensis]|uniref:Tail terminator n=1 Tax=Micromonospora mirobrigensis TaxID=262898 RepID=A0A1C4YPK5_9ACTN|nr:hypothetical protein [Micromonospora mirobrigensis]SCF22626.1 hypothetical protein GA0070564_104263 [Micromonospora mirobrigensis]